MTKGCLLTLETVYRYIVLLTIVRGVGGFFMGFFFSLFALIAGFLLLRLVCEAIVALHVIRQNSGNSGAEAPRKANSFNFDKESSSPFDKGTSFSADSYQQV